MIKSLSTPLALALALASVAGGATASPSVQTSSQTVRVSDLDLSSEKGAGIALRRIRNAAASVCSDGQGGSSPVLWSSRSYRSCVQQASSNAVHDLGSPMVSAHYNGGKPVQIARK